MAAKKSVEKKAAPKHEHEFRYQGDEYRIVIVMEPKEVEQRVQVYQCTCGEVEETEIA